MVHLKNAPRSYSIYKRPQVSLLYIQDLSCNSIPKELSPVFLRPLRESFLQEDISKIFSFFQFFLKFLFLQIMSGRSSTSRRLVQSFNIYQKLAMRSPTVSLLSIALSKDFYSKKAFGRCCIYSGPLKDSPSVEGF